MVEGNITRLRLLEEKDLDYYYIWINDPELARLVLGTATPYSQKHVRKLWHGQSCDHDLLFTIETLSQELVGFCFLRNIHPIHRFAELEQFFIVNKQHRNKGYGQDAIKSLISYCFNDLNLNRIWLITYDYNQSAIRLYEKSGFSKEGILQQVQFANGKFRNGIMMAILKKDWLVHNKGI